MTLLWAKGVMDDDATRPRCDAWVVVGEVCFEISGAFPLS